MCVIIFHRECENERIWDISKILVVDDDKGTVEVVKRTLVKQNYEVITAYDGVEGLEKVRSEEPDLIILDLRMPTMNGFQFMQTLNNELVSIHKPMIPIIIFTALVDMEETVKLEGSKGFLVKPLNPVVLLAKVEELLKKSL